MSVAAHHVVKFLGTRHSFMCPTQLILGVHVNYVMDFVVDASFSVNSNNTLSSSIISRYGSVANDRILEFRTARFGSASDSTNVILQCIAIGRWY